MDRTIKLGIIALVAVFALIAIASSVSADPSNINLPPTEDWVFDSGNTITIAGKAWDINYNITVQDGTVLKLDNCQFKMNGVNSLGYTYTAYIFTDDDSELVMTNSIFIAEEGSEGFYLEAHDDITLTNCEFKGLVSAPGGSGGISVIGDEFTKAQIDFVEVGDTWLCDGMYFENIFVDMSNSDIHDIDGSGVVFMGVGTEPNTWYNLSMLDTEIYNCAKNGLIVYGTDHFGMLGVDAYNVDIWNVSMDAVDLFLGKKSSTELGDGSIFAVFDQLNVYDIGDQGVYLSSHYTKAGTTSTSNIFNATFTNSEITDVTNAGMYVELEYCTVNFYLELNEVAFTNISVAGPTSTHLGGISWLFRSSQGEAKLHAENTLFKRVHPSAFEVDDYGGSEFEFVNCEFTKMNQTGAYLSVRSSRSQSPALFENCTFHDADAVGIISTLGTSASGTPIHVFNSTFYNLPYQALKAESTSYASGHGFNISGCNIYDIGSFGVLVGGYNMEGGMSLYMTNTTIFRTSGVRVEVSQDYVNAGAYITVNIINCTIDSTVGDALMVYGNAYYNPCRMDVQIINTTITDATGGGIVLKGEDAGTGASTGGRYKPRWDVTATIIGTSISDVGGIGLHMQAVGGMASNPSGGVVTMNYTTIRSAQRGVFSYGFKGSMYYCSVQN
ncbi:MAG: right-handed parallel beta-helix repeat-containing protein, partial [Thermoplasmata archaeon]|nr:right-handed parallel beta-helix repeat-containing protein [Thermoplasmata archaeon]